MSVKTKQASTGASPAANGIAPPPDPLQAFKSFEAAIRTFTSNTDFTTLSQLADRIPQLEDTIKERDGKINELNAQLETETKDHAANLQKELRNFGETYRELGDEKAALQATIDRLEVTLQDRNKHVDRVQKDLDECKAKGRELEGKYKSKLTKLKEKDLEISDLRKQVEVSCAKEDESSKKLSESRERVIALEKALQKAETRHGILQNKFNDTTQDLNELLSFGAPLDDVDVGTVARELDNLWKSATLVVGKYLTQEVPEEMLRNDWTELRDDTIFKLQIPLPQSNSPAAKEMRIAMVVGILARLVDRYIFQPTYILDERSGLRGLLRRQVAIDEKKESFTRAILLSMFPEEQEKNARQATEWVIEDLISSVVMHFLAPAEIVRFTEELKNVVVQAQECWRVVQCCKERLEPSFRYRSTDDTKLRWQTFEFQTAAREESQPASPITADDSEHELFVIFPRVYILKDEEPVTPGAVLRKALVRAAALEARENASPTPFAEPTLARQRPRRSREMSGSGEGMPGASSVKRFLRKGTWS